MSNNVEQPATNHYNNNNANRARNQTGANNLNEGESHYDEEVETKKSFFSKKKNGGCTAKFISLGFVRFAQFASSVITLGTTSFVRHSYGSHRASKQNFGIAVSAISTFRILFMYFFLLVARKFAVPGLFFISEIIICLLWLAAFLVLADLFGKYSCSTKPASEFDTLSSNNFQGFNPNNYLYYNQFLGQYTNSTYKNTCRTSKTAIAFAAVSFALFLLSSILIGLFIIKRIVKDYGGWKNVFKFSKKIPVPGNENGVEIHRGSGLALTNEKLNQIKLNGNTEAREEGDVSRTANNATGTQNQRDNEERFNTYSTQGSTMKSAGDEAYFDKQQQQTRNQYSGNQQNIGTIQEDRNMQQGSNNQQNTATASSGQKFTNNQEGATNSQMQHGYGSGVAGHSSRTAKAGTTGAGIVAGGNNLYGGYYDTDPIGDVVEGKESQAQTPIYHGARETEEKPDQPSLVQQAVDAGKKYMNVA